jgi:hypothetical protein
VGPITSSLRFDLTATDSASERFRALASNVEKLRRELVQLGGTKAEPKVKLDGADKALTDLDAIRARMAGLGDVRVKVKLDPPSAAEIRRLERVTEALRELAAVNGDQRIRIELSGLDPAAPNIIRRLAKALVELKAVGDVRIRVDLDGAAEALAALMALRAGLRGLPDTTTVRVNVAGAAAAAASVRALSMALAGLAIPGTLSAGVLLIGGLVSSVGALSGVLGLIPAGLAAAGIGAAALGVGLSGIGDAFKKLQAADEAAAAGASAAASARTAAAERIRSAQESLAQAQQAADRQAVDGARQVADAREALADAQLAAAERVASAQRALSDAQEQSAADVVAATRQVTAAQDDAAQAAERSARQVAAAERGVTSAQRDRLDAQQALTRAVVDAREAQEDLTLSLSGAALREERAVLDLAEAQEKLAAARAAGVGGRELQELDLDARDAQQSLAEVRERYEDLRLEAEQAARTGIEGSQGVVDAQRRVQDATAKVGDAEQSLADARTASGRSAVESAERIAAAQANLTETVADGRREIADAQAALVKSQLEGSRSVADAQQRLARTAESSAAQQADAVARVVSAQRAVVAALGDTGNAASAAAGKADVAFSKLAGNAQALITTVRALRPAWQDVKLDVQQRLLAGIADETKDLAGKYMPLLKSGLGGVATEINAGVRSWAEWARSTSAINDADRILQATTRSARELAPAGRNVAAAFTDIAVVGSDMLPELASGFTDATGRFRSFIAEARASGELEAWIQRGTDALGTLGSIAGNVGGTLGGIFAAAQDEGLDFLTTLDRLTGGLDDFINSAQGQTALHDLFAEARAGTDALLPGIRDLGDGAARMVSEFANTGGITASGEALSHIAAVLAPLLPMLGELAGGTLSALASGASLAATLLTPLVAGLGAVLDFLGPIAPTAAAMAIAFLVLGPVNAMVVALGVSLQALAIRAGLAGVGATGIATAFSRVGAAMPFIAAGLVLVSQAVDEATGDLEGYAKGFITGGDAARKAAADFAEHNSHFREGSILGDMFRISQAEVNGEIERQISLLPPLEQATARVQLAQTRYNDAVRDFGASSPQARAAQEALTVAVDREKVAQEDARRATESHTDAITRQADEAAAASNADLAYQQSLIRIEEAQDRAATATQQHGAASREARLAVLDGVQANLSAADAARRVAEANATARGETNAAEQGANAYASVLIDLAGKANGPVRQALLGYVGNLSESQRQAAGAAWETGTLRNTINSVPASKSTRFDTPGLTEAQRNVATLLNQVRALPTVYGINFSTYGGAVGRADGGIIPTRRFASGGIAGVLPGYTPGRDIYTVGYAGGGSVGLSGGEAVMRPEWTRAVGRRFVDDGNAAARAGGVAGVRRFMTSFTDGTGALPGGVGSGGNAPDMAAPIVAAIARLGADLRQVKRDVTITQNFLGITDKNAAARSAQALRTDAALGVFG